MHDNSILFYSVGRKLEILVRIEKHNRFKKVWKCRNWRTLYCVIQILSLHNSGITQTGQRFHTDIWTVIARLIMYSFAVICQQIRHKSLEHLHSLGLLRSTVSMTMTNEEENTAWYHNNETLVTDLNWENCQNMTIPFERHRYCRKAPIASENRDCESETKSKLCSGTLPYRKQRNSLNYDVGTKIRIVATLFLYITSVGWLVKQYRLINAHFLERNVAKKWFATHNWDVVGL